MLSISFYLRLFSSLLFHFSSNVIAVAAHLNLPPVNLTSSAPSPDTTILQLTSHRYQLPSPAVRPVLHSTPESSLLRPLGSHRIPCLRIPRISHRLTSLPYTPHRPDRPHGPGEQQKRYFFGKFTLTVFVNDNVTPTTKPHAPLSRSVN